ncbi:MAG: BTAD domain-containing putative transcriptional regulator [Chloroflexia bacterium]
MAPEAKFCSQCGTSLAPGSRFCPRCGTPVREIPAAPSPQAPVPTPTEPIVDVIPLQRRSGFMGMSVETFNLIVTPQRLILLPLSRQEVQEAVKEAREQARAAGRGFFGQWGAQLAWLPVLCARYRATPAESLAQTPGSTVLWKQEVRAIHPRDRRERDDEQTREWTEMAIETARGRLRFEVLTICPERDPQAAQSFFHHATSSLRRALEPDLPEKFPSRYLEVEEGRVTLHLPAGSWVDFEAFEACCRRGEWEATLSLYGGEFLPESRYADWTMAPRERLSLLYQQALLAAARSRLAEGRPAEALDACRRLLALEPWHEEAVLLGMRACVALNDLAGARRLYLALEKALREDLGTAPQEELQTLYRSLTPSATP